MNTYTKQYLREVKALFPSKGKKERDYLKKLSITIEEYCEEEQINNKQAIYEKYGKPIDIVYDYYSSLDVEIIVRKIRLSKIVRTGVVIIVVVALLCGIIYALVKYQANERDKEMAMVDVEEEIITTGNWDDNGNPLPLDYNPYAESETAQPTEK